MKKSLTKIVTLYFIALEYNRLNIICFLSFRDIFYYFPIRESYKSTILCAKWIKWGKNMN